jgi:hypothetical protein
MSLHESVSGIPRAEPEPLIFTKTEDGYRVYTPSGRSKPYFVTGIPDEPGCTCTDFRRNADDPDYQCEHIAAVLRRFGNGHGRDDRDTEEREERRAIQQEQSAESPRNGNGAAEMLLKRSVSPDGRIDSLSVEFSVPVDDDADGAVESRALMLMKLQDGIVRRFLGRNGKHAETPRSDREPRQNGDESDNDPIDARLLDVGEMDTRRGRRLFIAVKANGKTLKLFGTRTQLADHVASAGFPDEEIYKGVRLDLPCRVITKPSNDGRYVDIVEVLPALRRSSRNR